MNSQERKKSQARVQQSRSFERMSIAHGFLPIAANSIAVLIVPTVVRSMSLSVPHSRRQCTMSAAKALAPSDSGQVIVYSTKRPMGDGHASANTCTQSTFN